MTPSAPSKPPFAHPFGPEEVVRMLRHLPSAPRVLPRLKRLLSDGNSSMHEVVSLIRLDPGIAARVLQLGNSAYYTHGMRCYTVDEAVNRVGYDQVYELVAHAVASQVLVRPLAVYGIEADELWRMSVACGLAAEIFAERINADRDIAYTIGLLHGVGLVAIDEWAFRQQWELRITARSWPLESCEAERATLGFHNAEAGAALLRFWEFPAIISEPVRWQYLPRGTAAHFQYACMLHVAKWLRTAVCRGLDGMPQPDTTFLRAVNSSPGELERLVINVAEQLTKVSSLLEPLDCQGGAIVEFPNGPREIVDHGQNRSLINRYA